MNPLLDIENLHVVFDTEDGPLRAVDGVSLSLRRGEIFGLVGESGCGKSVTALSILRLVPSPPGRIAGGRIRFNGREVLTLPPSELRALRGREISMIFQEPMSALSPLHRIGAQLVEAIRLHDPVPRRAAQATARDWLAKVGIPDPDRCMLSYPYELSGGMRQRVMIAMALLFHPALIIADEPTTALDVTVQAQVLELMRRMKEHDTSLLLITHDMGVVWDMCDRVAVMYAGEIVEQGPVQEVFARPLHPYTEALLASVPPLEKVRRLSAIDGQVPSPLRYPPACRFADRCPFVTPRCRTAHPELQAFGERLARCVLAPERAAAKGGSPS